MVYYTRHGVETVVDNAGGNRAVVNFCGRSLYWASIPSAIAQKRERIFSSVPVDHNTSLSFLSASHYASSTYCAFEISQKSSKAKAQLIELLKPETQLTNGKSSTTTKTSLWYTQASTTLAEGKETIKEATPLVTSITYPGAF
ncbi:hypothetical protein PHLCEN_2v4565 [Hermanssonia centrifuga]|uniref:Uncharacterized protein n=1 Tax=Hermanssonia centrifuga TaxID=98765 RepID=A0A2R6PNG3_9APHY|nr:hypothetical protein PHLCEN_2v4565 [Hermanssonia centrifuga]